MINFVYFDVGQVLVSNKKGWKNFLDQNNFDEATAELFWNSWGDISDKLCEGSIDESSAISYIERGAGVNLGDDFSLVGTTVDLFEPIDHTQNLLMKCSKHFEVGLLSNAYDGMLEKLFEQNKLPDIEFTTIVDSSQVKIIKPNVKIFELATKEAGVLENEILFIDDNEKNIEAAKNYGWNAYWFNEDNAEKNVREIETMLKIV